MHINKILKKCPECGYAEADVIARIDQTQMVENGSKKVTVDGKTFDEIIYKEVEESFYVLDCLAPRFILPKDRDPNNPKQTKKRVHQFKLVVKDNPDCEVLCPKKN